MKKMINTKALLAFVIAIGVFGCTSKPPETVGVTGIVYNYSQESYALVKVNGKTVGTALEKVPYGDVGGGGGMCCFQLPVGATEAEVFLDLALEDGVTVTATIEKWWPDLAHYGVVHILPGRKVVIEIRSVYVWPRRDLLNSALKELSLTPTYNYTGPMNDGPLERTDGKQ